MNPQELNKKLDKVKNIVILAAVNLKGNFDEEKEFQKDYGMDSLDLVAIISEIETEFDIEIDTDNIETLKNFKAVREYIINNYQS